MIHQDCSLASITQIRDYSFLIVPIFEIVRQCYLFCHYSLKVISILLFSVDHPDINWFCLKVDSLKLVSCAIVIDSSLLAIISAINASAEDCRLLLRVTKSLITELLLATSCRSLFLMRDIVASSTQISLAISDHNSQFISLSIIRAFVSKSVLLPFIFIMVMYKFISFTYITLHT